MCDTASCRGLQLDLEAELGELREQALGLGFGGTAIEVGTAEVAVEGAVLDHVIDGGEERGGDGADGFLRPAPALQPEELSCISSDLT